MFDVNPAPDRNPHLETAIVEGGTHDRSIRLAQEACEFFEITDANARKIIRDVAQRISDGWRETFRRVGVRVTQLCGYEDAFVHEESKIALTL
jgi:serine/threonine-protein kinase HipA